MDIGELLSYKPPNTPKRPQADEDDDDDVESEYDRQRKMRRLANERRILEDIEREREKERERRRAQEEEERREAIMKVVDNHMAATADNSEMTGILDENSLKRAILLFEKRALRNREMRIKFPDSAEKFMESEVELHEAVVELHAVATAPHLYSLIVELGAVPSLLELLSHENTDISVAIVDLLQELTDVDILNEGKEGADTLIDALLERQVCALLVQNLERLDESVKEETDGVHNTLAVFENVIEFRPDIVVDVAGQGLMQWILKRLRMKPPYDPNKLYASEMLSILLQNCTENQQVFGDMDGIDVLLQQLAFYKRHDPQTAEEGEMMENLFDCVCSGLSIPANKERFLRGEGLQLMNLMLREKKLSRNGSLRALNHAMSGPDGRDNCNKFVDILGLRTIFPLFMKTPRKNRKKVLTTEEHEEHVVSIISSMLRNCRGTQRQRLMSKFTENDHEKVDRLLELHFKYLDKVEESDARVEELRKLRKEEGGDEDDDEDEEEVYLRRLEGGLFTLQLVDYVLLEVCTGGPSSIKQRVLQILNLRGGSLKAIRHVMREYAGNLGDAGDSQWKENEQQHILQLVDKF